MSPKTSQLYHLFLALAMLNMLAFYLLNERSTLDIHKKDNGFFDDESFNYSFSVTLLILLIWLSYRIFRKKIYSFKLILLHLHITFITVFVLPWLLYKFIDPMPRRYLDYVNGGFKLSDIFGSMTKAFILVALILIISELLLIANIRKQPPKIILFDSEV
ncbi:hypothetical protein A3860_09560 [Niastella vici]|uniref:Uncharacterized protein n=1 Tax=Niastella vici TaxID=1703345 RepID=A0A1V9FEX1_9BACT|nr:hypothetical protein A3860_09560 [Niastella vici]